MGFMIILLYSYVKCDLALLYLIIYYLIIFPFYSCRFALYLLVCLCFCSLLFVYLVMFVCFVKLSVLFVSCCFRFCIVLYFCLYVFAGLLCCFGSCQFLCMFVLLFVVGPCFFSFAFLCCYCQFFYFCVYVFVSLFFARLPLFFGRPQEHLVLPAGPPAKRVARARARGRGEQVAVLREEGRKLRFCLFACLPVFWLFGCLLACSLVLFDVCLFVCLLSFVVCLLVFLCCVLVWLFLFVV